MSKQLSKNEWLYYFDLYEKDYYKFVYEYTKRRGKWNHNIKSIFVNKYKTFKYNNIVLFNLLFVNFFMIFFS